MKSEYMTVKEVAEAVRRTPQTIYRWLTEGVVFKAKEFTKVRDGYLINKTAVDRIVKR